MATQIISANSSISSPNSSISSPNSSTVNRNSVFFVRTLQFYRPRPFFDTVKPQCGRKLSVNCSENRAQSLRTCKNCKKQFDPSLNHPRSCRYHTAHFGGETKRKFESVYTGGTMDTPDSGKVFQYWHCCGSEDPFDLGCTAGPHASYDD